MRDSNLLQNVLSENYAHIDATGRLRYREDELAASTKTRRQREVRSEQTVDFAGDVAIVRGISTRRAAGKTTRLRYGRLPMVAQSLASGCGAGNTDSLAPIFAYYCGLSEIKPDQLGNLTINTN